MTIDRKRAETWVKIYLLCKEFERNFESFEGLESRFVDMTAREYDKVTAFNLYSVRKEKRNLTGAGNAVKIASLAK